jgi:large subunit ribosomal protein L7/L12
MSKSTRLIQRWATKTSSSIPSSNSRSALLSTSASSSSYTSNNTRPSLSNSNFQLLLRRQRILPCLTGAGLGSNTRGTQSYHSSASLFHLVHKDADAAKPTEEELAETEDTVPVWQNPLHHNNPEMKKMFEEDFEDGEEMPCIPMPPLETDPDKVVASPHIHDLAHEIVHLNLLELKELTDKIAVHFDFDDEMMAANYGGGGVGGGAAGGDGAAAEAEAVEEKTIFDLKLIGFDAKAKIKVIKEVRSIGGLGLKEAKELVEGAPKIIQKDLKQDKAEELKAKLEAVGAQVEIV